ncbi:hypothetical protein C8039_01115 [Halogeometricum sp. wsp3]|nr:hypothetical protein C8039_01115 [Halogeometricum sp. wsp3]
MTAARGPIDSRAADSDGATVAPSANTRSSTGRKPPLKWRDQTGPSENTLDPRIAEAGPEATPSADGGTATTGRDAITETAVHQGDQTHTAGTAGISTT